MKLKGSRSVLVVILVTAMLALAPGASAASTNLVVASGNDTGAELGSQQLTNLTVSGETVVLEGSRFSDSFEDEPADVGVPENWDPHNGLASSGAEVRTGGAAEGSQYAWVDGGDFEGIRRNFSSTSTDKISARINASTSSTQVMFGISDGGGDGPVAVGLHGGDLEYFDGGSWVTIATAPDDNEWVYLEYRNWDLSAGTVELYWEEPGGAAGTQTFDIGAADGFDSVRLYTVGGPGRLDTVTHGGAVESAQYVGTHSADNVEQAQVVINDLSNATIEATVRVDGSAVGSSTISSAGTHNISLPSVSSSNIEVVLDVNVTGESPSVVIDSEALLFDAAAPSATLKSPADGEELTESSVDFTVQVNDSDFALAQGDNVTAQLQLQEPGSSTWTDYGSQNVLQNNSVTVEETLSMGGTYEYRWELTDDYGEVTTTSSRSLSVPATLSIRNESDPDQLITGASLEVTFYGETTVYTRNDSNNDGQINLTGLPVDEPLVATVSAEGYKTRTVVVPGLFQQQNVFLLDENTTTVETRFTLKDNTGQFGEGSRIVVKKAITLNNTTAYRVAAADTVGVKGFTTELVEGDRYFVSVVSPNGDSRDLGAYPADVSEEVVLEIGQVDFGANARGDEVQWEAEWTNETAPPTITFSYRDNDNNTTTVDVQVYQQSDPSNVIFDDSIHGGDIGTVVTSVDISNASLYDENWVVEFTAERGGEEITGKWIVGPNQGAMELPIDSQWAAWASMGLLVVVGIMLGGVSPELGSLGVSVVGGILLWVGWLPSFIGGGVVILGLFVTGLMITSSRGGL